jgi:hypothetical protein
MSIYHPPLKTQSVFNPTNFGGLGAGGQITTDYLDANYLQFPVSQGNMTLVGTSVLGDITQQGDLTTTGDITGETIKATSILVGTTNIIDEIGTRHPNINDGDLTIANTDGLQTALDNKYDDTGGTIDGNVTITGDLVIGTTNVITEIGTKQDEINDGDLTIAKTDGLQTALDNKYDDTGGTIDGNVTITGDLVIGTTNVITEIGTKQDSIQDDDLTIAKTSGLQTALDDKQDTISNFEINGNVNLNTSGTNFDTIVVRRPTNVTGITDDYLIDLNELQIWVNDANILVENASSLISSVVSWSNKDIDLGSQKLPTNLYNGVLSDGDGVLTLDPSPTDIAIIIKNIPTTKINDIHAVQVMNNTSATLGNRAIGLAIELYNSKNDPDLTTILAQSNEISVMDSVYRFDFPSIDTYTLVFNGGGILPDSGAYVNLVTLEVVTPFSFPFNVIGNLDVSGSLILPTIGDVEDAIQGKEPTIQDNGLTIAKTSGLQTALDNKYDDTGGTIDGNVTITGDLVIGTTNVITEIGTKQEEITTDTDLSCNSLNTNQLIVDNSEYFDTIVIRRITANDVLHFRELQFWVNDVNVLPSYTIPSSASNNTSTNVSGNALGETIEFFNNNTTLSGLDIAGITYRASNIANEIIDGVGDTGYDTVGTTNSSLYIPLNTTININEVQSIVLYNRFDAQQGRAIGFAIELYNRADDPTLSDILVSTNAISTAEHVYRFDFPAIDTYPSGDFSDTDSISQIASETLALKEVVSEFADSANITGGLKVDTITTTGNVDISGNTSITGDLVVGTTNVITEIGTKQDTIQDNGLTIAKTDGLQTALDNKYDDTGGTIEGNVTITGDLVVGSTNIITEIGTKQDEITTSTDLNCNTLSAVGDITTTTGYVNDISKRYFISSSNFDLDGLTTFNLRTDEEYLTDFISHDGNGRYDVNNLTSSKLCIITIICSVSSDVYDSGISWRLRPFRNGSNFPAFGSKFCFTNGVSSQQSEATLVARVFTGLVNGQYFNFVIDQDRGTGTYGEVMDGSKIISSVSIYFDIVG